MDNFTVYNGTSYPGNVDEPAPASELNVLAYDQFNSVANWSGGCTVLPGELVCDTPLNEEAFYIHRLPNVTENNNNWSVEFDMAIPDCDTDWAILVTEKNDTGGEIGYGVHKEGIGTHPKVDSPDGNTSHDQELKEIICYEENAIVKWHHWKIVFFQNQSVGTYIDNVVNLSNPDSMMDYSSKPEGTFFQFSNDQTDSFNLKVDNFIAYNGTATTFCFQDEDGDGFNKYCNNVTLDCDDGDASIRPPKDGETISANVTFCRGTYEVPTNISCGGNTLKFGDFGNLTFI